MAFTQRSIGVEDLGLTFLMALPEHALRPRSLLQQKQHKPVLLHLGCRRQTSRRPLQLHCQARGSLLGPHLMSHQLNQVCTPHLPLPVCNVPFLGVWRGRFTTTRSTTPFLRVGEGHTKSAKFDGCAPMPPSTPTDPTPTTPSPQPPSTVVPWTWCAHAATPSSGTTRSSQAPPRPALALACAACRAKSAFLPTLLPLPSSQPLPSCPPESRVRSNTLMLTQTPTTTPTQTPNQQHLCSNLHHYRLPPQHLHPPTTHSHHRHHLHCPNRAGGLPCS